MKKTFYISLTGLLFIFGFTIIQTGDRLNAIQTANRLTANQTADNCDKKALSASCKKKLDPFKYDNQKFTKINFTKKAQQLEVEVPVFIGERYRVVFNTSGLPKEIKINIYTKDKEARKREAIFSNTDLKAEGNEFIFDAPRTRKMFIDYSVPADSTNQKITGCVIFMVGYK